MEQWLAFVQERWFVIIAALVVLMIVINVVKTVIKWVIVLAVLGGIVFYGANYTDQIKEVGGQLVTQFKDEALKQMAGEVKEAKYTANPDGSFVITTTSIKIEGAAGAAEVTLYFKGQKVGTFPIEGALQAFIEAAKQQK
ncbi:hypothetical protein [Paenibacillus turpanensis]|uniref:hypothetical protein n=1 Tax=Paenibacillus turpanensis TaxID=2689078 RepID=UPI00140DE0AA|nr:hypothetical protein [Paenibacillus turpanensis]